MFTGEKDIISLPINIWNKFLDLWIIEVDDTKTDLIIFNEGKHECPKCRTSYPKLRPRKFLTCSGCEAEFYFSDGTHPEPINHTKREVLKVAREQGLKIELYKVNSTIDPASIFRIKDKRQPCNCSACDWHGEARDCVRVDNDGLYCPECMNMVLVTLSSLDKLTNELKDVLLDEFSELKRKSGDYHLGFLRSMVEYLNTLNNSKEPILNLKYIEVIERNVLYRTTML